MEAIQIRGIIAYSLIPAALARQCLKNDDIGWREGNIYECNDSNKPECCEENQTFTCCSSQMSVEDQLVLWGSVAGFILVVAILCMYYRSGDSSTGCCTFDEKGLLGSIRHKCCKPREKDKGSVNCGTGKGGRASFSKALRESQKGVYHPRNPKDVGDPYWIGLKDKSFRDDESIDDGHSEAGSDYYSRSKYFPDTRKTWG